MNGEKKMSKPKRAIAVLLVFLLVISTPLAAYADEVTEGSNGTDLEVSADLESETEQTNSSEELEQPLPDASADAGIREDDPSSTVQVIDGVDKGVEYPTEGYEVVESQDLTDEAYAEEGEFDQSEATGMTAMGIGTQASSSSWKAKKGQTVTVTNLYGATRFETNTDIVKASYNKAETVILASAENFPDALSGSTLSGVLDAPIVLVNKASLSAESASTIKGLGAKKIIVLGSSAAISEKTYTAAKKLVSNPDSSIRLGGKDRYETNAKIYQYLKKLGYQASTTVIVATGQNFADALSISSYAAWSKTPVILAGANGLNSTMQAELKSFKGKVVVCGSEAAVSASNANWFQKNGAAIARYGGSHRYATSRLIAEYAISQGMDSASVVVATGQNFPDALSGAQIGNKHTAPIMLVNGQTDGLAADEAIREYLGKYDAAITSIIYLGSNAAVKDSKRAAIKDFLAGVPTYTVTWNGFDLINPNTAIISYNAAIKQTYKRGQTIKAPSFAFTFNSPVDGKFHRECWDVPQRQDGSYCFAGWNKSFDKATGDMTITAKWKKVTAAEYNGIPGGNTWPTAAEVAAYRNSDSAVPWNPANWSVAYSDGTGLDNIGGFTAASLARGTAGANWHAQVWRQIKEDSGAIGGYKINYYILETN